MIYQTFGASFELNLPSTDRNPALDSSECKFDFGEQLVDICAHFSNVFVHLCQHVYMIFGKCEFENHFFSV